MSSAVEYSQSFTIEASSSVWALTFTENGEYLVGGGREGVEVWRAEDGKRMAVMPQLREVRCVAVSKDGRFIAAGSDWGDAWIWDATTHEKVFARKILGEPMIFDVDFSPGSTRLVVSASDGDDNTATIWDFAAYKQVQTLGHGQHVCATKYSPRGDRIATASDKSVCVWDSSNGRLLVNVAIGLCPFRGLLWFKDHLLVKTHDSKIRQIDASTGSTISEWSAPRGNYSAIALPQHEGFIVYSTMDGITFWDTSTHTQLGFISRSSSARSVAFSPNHQLAIVAQERKIIIHDPPFIGAPDIRIEGGPLCAWKNGQLTKAEALLTTIPSHLKGTAHHILASRALVRTRLRQWDAALVDAEESIKTQASTFGYIAKCVALVGRGDVHAAYRMWDIALLCASSDHVVIFLIKAVVLFMAGEHKEAISRVDDLVAVKPLDQTFHVVQAHMYLLLGNLCMESGDYNHAIQSFRDAQHKLSNQKTQPPLIISLISGWKFDDLAITIQLQLCEALLSAGHTKEAAESALCTAHREANMNESVRIWVTVFTQRCLSAPENKNDASSATGGDYDESHPVTALLREWVKSRLTTGSWRDALTAATGFTLPRFTVYQVICEHLENTGYVADAVSCFHQMYGEMSQEIDDRMADWTRDLVSRCHGKLEDTGDIAANNKKYDEAILQYTTALSLDPAIKQVLLVKRSTAYAGKGELDEALKDADEVIRLDPDSPLGYERRHAALHHKGDHNDANAAYETMLLKMSKSSDPEIRERSRHYVWPEVKRETIRTTIEDTIRDSPVVLIDTAHGRLCNKSEQVVAFESTPTFTRLISSMTTRIDHASITKEIAEFYRYVTFSHKWEENEPLFETVIRIVVYDLEKSPAHEKLQMFCKLVREAGFNWAWSDTCCINKGDHFVLQEALVSMFKWYERSAMTFIFLRGVRRLALRGALTRSIWNMRAWTLQEYHASKVVRIYTEDWTPYLGLDIYNHKDSPEVISEMEEATGISAQALIALRPGLDDIREKLRLASMRQTTRVEDAAYSLLGIFSLSLPITYGEGDKALGRLLSQLLASSGDTSILAWTGKSGSFNSCLPFSITVFNQPPASHIPPVISDAKMGTAAARLRLPNPALLTTLYDRVNDLPVPSFSGLRMKLPCLAFKLGQVSVSQSGTECVFRAQTNTLGVVEIRTEEDLSKLGSLHLAHPWIDFLLDRLPVGSVTETTIDMSASMSFVPDEFPSSPGPSDVPLASQQIQTARRVSRTRLSLNDAASLLPPSTLSPVEKQMRLLQFAARLRQPFGALLLAPTRRNIEEYRRVAAESQVVVQVKELTPVILDKLMGSVRVLDIL